MLYICTLIKVGFRLYLKLKSKTALVREINIFMPIHVCLW